MGRCFVIQPFDGGKFDKRYDDVLLPAIQGAGLEPYRVDRDPHAVIPIDEIATQIANSEACLCDITTDNPNVWFELGFAIACQREVVLICSDERATHFPFDVQHRTIIKYSTDSSSDFEALKAKIQARLTAMLEKRDTLEGLSAMTPISRVEGLEQFEIAVLVSIAQQLDYPEDTVSVGVIRQDMENAGFTKLATTLGLKSLLGKQLLETRRIHDEYDESYEIQYSPTDHGMQWLFANKDKLALTSPRPSKTETTSDIPF